MTIAEPTDGDIFLAYLEQVLCPQLRPGQVVIMDNLSAHKVDGVCQLIEATGAKLIYLPPYSPDLNPIEQAWSKIKQILRSLKARTVEALDNGSGRGPACYYSGGRHCLVLTLRLRSTLIEKTALRPSFSLAGRM